MITPKPGSDSVLTIAMLDKMISTMREEPITMAMLDATYASWDRSSRRKEIKGSFDFPYLPYLPDRPIPDTHYDMTGRPVLSPAKYRQEIGRALPKEKPFIPVAWDNLPEQRRCEILAWACVGEEINASALSSEEHNACFQAAKTGLLKYNQVGGTQNYKLDHNPTTREEWMKLEGFRLQRLRAESYESRF